jgi:hypothetical protein
MMKRGWRNLILVGWGLWPTAACADLTLTGYSVAGAFGMPLSSQEKIWIHGRSLRRDFVDRGRAQTQLFDLAAREVAVIDHFSRLVEIHDLKNLQATTEVNAPASGLKMTLEKTGQVLPLRTWKCEAHTLKASMPARLGTEEAVFHLSGLIWVASGVPEQAAVKDLVKLTRQADFFLGIPTIAKITPAQAQMLSEIIRKLAPKGLPCSGELDASIEGNGPMANLAKRMPTKFSMTFQDFSTEPIQQEMFAIPAGYQQIRR